MSNVKLSAKSTKAELLTAVQEKEKENRDLKKQLQTDTTTTSKKVEQSTALVTYAKDLTPAGIVNAIASVKTTTVASFEEIEKVTLAKFAEFTRISEAKDILVAELKELHGIEVNAETLQALAETIAEKQEEWANLEAVRKQDLDEYIQTKRDSFDTEMTGKKAEWNKQQTEYRLAVEEDKKATSLQRGREEENYVYNRDLTRRNEENEYRLRQTAAERQLVDKVQAGEKELTQRIAAVELREANMNVLEAKVAEFPDKLAAEIKAAEGRGKGIATNTAERDKALLEKDMEVQKQTAEIKIQALEEKVEGLQKHNEKLQSIAEQASERVQTMALESVKGSAQSKVIINNGENEERSSSKR